MPRSDFATSAEYHADAANRALDLIQTTVARIDAAVEKLERSRHRCSPFTFSAVRDELMSNRRDYLARVPQVKMDGSYLCGRLGANERLAKIDALIAQVERISKAPVYVAYVPPALRDAGRAAA